MTPRVLVAVEDSGTGLRTAAVAVELAEALGASLLVMHVLTDGELEAALGADRRGRQQVAERRRASSAALLRHVVSLAGAHDVRVSTRVAAGDAARRILEAARAWAAGVIVIGRCERDAAGPHYVGAQTRHVLEFAEQPVLVVPRPHLSSSARSP